VLGPQLGNGLSREGRRNSGSRTTTGGASIPPPHPFLLAIGKGIDDDLLRVFDLLPTKRAVRAAGIQPAVEADVADQMTAWLQFHVLVILSTDLAHLEGGAHLTVDLVLLLCHLNVLLLRGGEDLRQVHIHVLAVGIQVATHV